MEVRLYAFEQIFGNVRSRDGATTFPYTLRLLLSASHLYILYKTHKQNGRQPLGCRPFLLSCNFYALCNLGGLLQLALAQFFKLRFYRLVDGGLRLFLLAKPDSDNDVNDQIQKEQPDP